MTSLYQRLDEADAFSTCIYPTVSWEDVNTIVISETGMHLSDVTVLCKEVYLGAMTRRIRRQAMKRMLLNVGKKIQGKCIRCSKQFGNMLPKQMNAIHGSHDPNKGKKVHNPTQLANKSWGVWEHEFSILKGFECCKCHGGE